VPFRGRPPELLARSSEDTKFDDKPRAEDMFGVLHTKLEELAEEDDSVGTEAPAHNEPAGKSTASFAGSEPKVPPVGDPPS